MLHSIINMKNRNNKFQHKLAKLNYYQSVEKVFDLESKETNLILFGVKNVQQVPKHLVELLEKSKKYRLHTTDSYALGGRAIDLRLNNPITGRYMTGSSSGTAINVFVGINDIGIGIDGGGSVLGPAMSLNLFGFISPLICYQHMRKFKKRSTDGIEFSPSVGLMARDFKLALSR